jgi:type I restriction enzyme S subunit
MSVSEVPLAKLMAPRDGSVDPARYPNETFCLYSIPSFDAGAPELLPGSSIGSAKQIVRPGDVLLSRIVPHIRRAWIVKPQAKYRIIASGEWIVFRSPRADSRYLRHFLTSDNFHRQFMATVAGVGGSLLRARPSQVAEIRVPLPHPSEQRRIAAILDKADAIRLKRKEAIALTEELLRSAFLEMFGDPVTNPRGWPRQPFGKLASIRRGASPRPIERYMGGSIPWIKIGDATSTSDIYLRSTAEFVTEEGARKSVRLKPGALIVANSGVSLGFARVLRIEGCIHDGWLAFEDIHERLRKIYLVGLINLLTPYFRRLAPEGTQPNLNTSLMRSFEVPLPPPDLQDEYEGIVSKLSDVTLELRRATSQAEGLFSSLVQRAFSTNMGALAC